MKSLNNTVALAGVLLSVLAAQATFGAAANSPGTIAARPGGFLTESGRRAPSSVDDRAGGLVDKLCARATGRSPVRCPSGASGAGASDEIAANLPHLRLNIILREMRNVVVSGSGVASLGLLQDPWATFKIESTTATVSIPTAADPPFGLPVPAPGETWSDIPHANALFQGIIENGCLGPPATFDLTLDSSIYRINTGETFGSVHLADSVQGHGYYNFKYTIRATDETGNVSDFVFSGDADSYCTSQSNFSSGSDGGEFVSNVEAGATLSPVSLAASAAENSCAAMTLTDLVSAPASDFITQEDMDRSPRGYELNVPGFGVVYVMDPLRRPGGKDCRVHKPSLIKAITADPPTANSPSWINLTIYNYAGWTYCGCPKNGACYRMIRTP